MTLGERIRLARKYNELSMPKLASICGIYKNTIFLYEKNKVEPSLFNATCIADALDVSLDYLVGKDEALEKKFMEYMECDTE